MALTVTPGGAADDSLLTLAYFKTYCTAMGKAYDTYDDETDIEPAIRKATIFVEGLGSPQHTRKLLWPGSKTNGTQRRLFPRTNATEVDGTAIDSATIPLAVQEAVAEAAHYELENAGTLQAAVVLGQVASKESVGSAGVSVSYKNEATMQQARTMLTAVSDLLSPILRSEGKGKSMYMKTVGTTI